MEIDILIWFGFGLVFFFAFLLSLFNISMSVSSKISVSRILEDKEKQYRVKILEIYDDLKISVQYTRAVFIIAFLVYLFVIFPKQKYWPLWLFLLSLAD